MIKKTILILMAIMPFVGTVEGTLLSKLFGYPEAQANQPPRIRVLIASDRPGVVLEVKGKYRLYDPCSNEFVSTGYIGKRGYMQAVKDGLRWGEGFPGLHQLMIVPENAQTTIVVDGIEYSGSFLIYDVEGFISVVNDIDVESYIKSLLCTQVRDALPAETLAALTIAARTNAYFQIQHAANPFWHVDGNKTSYQGEAVINTKSPINHAVFITRFMALSKNANQLEPFPASWSPEQGVVANIPLEKAVEMARKGNNAAQILEKAFPNSNIILGLN